MSFSGPVETDESAIPEAVRKFFQNRLYEVLGLALLGLLLCLTLALATWSPADHGIAGEKRALNWFGAAGAALSDMLMRIFGLGTIGVLAVPTIWSLELMAHRLPEHLWRRLAAWLVWLAVLTGFFSVLPLPQSWPLSNGPGGALGSLVSTSLLWLLSFGLKGAFAHAVAVAVTGFLSISTFFWAINHPSVNARLLAGIFGARGQDAVDACIGALGHTFMSLGWAFGRLLPRRNAQEPKPSLIGRIFTGLRSPRPADEAPKLEPVLAKPKRKPKLDKRALEETEDEEDALEEEAFSDLDTDDEDNEDGEAHP